MPEIISRHALDSISSSKLSAADSMFMYIMIHDLCAFCFSANFMPGNSHIVLKCCYCLATTRAETRGKRCTYFLCGFCALNAFVWAGNRLFAICNNVRVFYGLGEANGRFHPRANCACLCEMWLYLHSPKLNETEHCARKHGKCNQSVEIRGKFIRGINWEKLSEKRECCTVEIIK